jgi:hypothetical protein
VTAPVELTDDIRQAVHDEDCARLGHHIDTNTAVLWGGGSERVEGPAGQMPHFSCRRCGRVWIVVADPGRGYDDAEAKFRARLKDPASA